MGIFFSKKSSPSVTPLSFFNTLSNKIEPFLAIKPPQVKMYTCGPTVYDFATIGNLRSYVFSDTLKRTLTYNNFSVEHTINLTDFGHLTSDADEGEDKMMLALKREGKQPSLVAMLGIADTYTNAFQNDMDALNILPPTQYTRASNFIKEEIALVKVLVEKGYTYETSDGIYFDISRFPEYGKLGNIDIEKLRDGARVEVNPEKRHPADFAVWKKGELGWDSAWGKGFPGWHIECTAMVFATLGKQIDIHTGGIDHIATHHNGEIAQAEAATGKSPYVKYWMHNAFITIESRRIGKSEGNAITLRQLGERGYAPEDYRYWLLTAHYRSPANFTFEALNGAKQALFRLKRHIYEEFGAEAGTVSEKYKTKFISAINNDLDLPKAVALLWEVVGDKELPPGDKAATICEFDKVLGLGLSDPVDTTKRSLGIVEIEDLPLEVQKLITERETARTEKNWEQADTLREAINLKGYLVDDRQDGPRVTKMK